MRGSSVPTASTKPGAGSARRLARLQPAGASVTPSGATTVRPAAAGKWRHSASAVACEIASSAAARRTAGPSVRRSITVERRFGRIAGSKVTRSYTIGTAGMRRNSVVR